MKTELRVVPHSVLRGNMVEIWHDGKLIGAIYGADQPGIRVVTKHEIECVSTPAPEGMPQIMEVLIHQ